MGFLVFLFSFNVFAQLVNPPTDQNILLFDVTTNNASASKHGFLPKLDNTGTKYLRDDGTWQTISGGSGFDTIGTLNELTKSARGASSTGTTLVMQAADATFPGIVSVGTQTFSGDKTIALKDSSSTGILNNLGTISGGTYVNMSITSGTGTLSNMSINNSTLSGGSASSFVCTGCTINEPTVSATDGLITIVDNVDNSKKFQFEASGITAGSTRVLTIPDFTGTFALTTNSQTITNKTLDSTVVSGTGGSQLGGLITNNGIISGGHVSGSTVLVLANKFTLIDSVNEARKAVFNTVNITVGQTRTYTFPDRSDTFVQLGGAQILANKKLDTLVTLSGTINSNENIIVSPTKGIDFAATINSSGTVTSEVFNDFETGTCDPWVSHTTTMNATGLSGTYTTRSCRYTKIGPLVSFDMVLAWTSVSGTGNIVIVGVPFTPTVATACSFHADGLALTASNVLQGYVESSTPNRVVLQQLPTGGSSATAVAKDNSVSALRIQCDYHTSSAL